MTTNAISALRKRISEIASPRREHSPPLTTGITPLDLQLRGGIPRGRITQLSAPTGAGKTALLREIASNTLADNQWVAWVDTTHTLAPAPWATLGKRFVAIRPASNEQALRATEILLQSGVFHLVVLDDAPFIPRNTCAKLAKIAREKDAALVVTTEPKTIRLAGTLLLRITPDTTPIHTRTSSPSLATRHCRNINARRSRTPYTPHTLSHQTVEVHCATPSPMARSLRAHPEIPDRRGVAR